MIQEQWWWQQQQRALGSAASGAASLTSRLQPLQQFAKDLVFTIKSPIALDT